MALPVGMGHAQHLTLTVQERAFMSVFPSISWRSALLATLVMGMTAACPLSRAGGADPSEPAVPAGSSVADQSDHSHDFDGFFGNWRTHHRKLKERLAGSHDWMEFEGSQVMQPVLGGRGNMTDNVFNMPDGSIRRGVTLRAFDPKTHKWSIWWLGGEDPTEIGTPVVGGFERGTGAFYADDTFDGKPIKVRFLWKNVTPNSRQWEQAFSADGGKTWETNWITWFTRVP
jgi:hypothetical protein